MPKPLTRPITVPRLLSIRPHSGMIDEVHAKLLALPVGLAPTFDRICRAMGVTPHDQEGRGKVMLALKILRDRGLVIETDEGESKTYAAL